jgi:hypothetical protein
MSKPLSQNEDMKPAGGMETLCALGSQPTLILNRVVCPAPPAAGAGPTKGIVVATCAVVDRDHGGSKGGIYSDMKASTEDKAHETTGEAPISQLYQNANASAETTSVPGSTDASKKMK